MKWKLIESTFEGVTKQRWVANTSVAKFSAPADTDPGDLDDLVFSETGFTTKDGRPVLCPGFNKVLDSVETDSKKVKVSRADNLEEGIEIEDVDGI